MAEKFTGKSVNKFAVEAAGFQIVPDRCTQEEIVIVCPSCSDQSGNRGISVSTALTNCWRCGIGGNFFKWARGLGYEIEELEATALTVDEAQVYLNQLQAAANATNKVVPVYVSPVDLPRGFTRLEDEPNCYHARAIEKMARQKRLYWEDFVEAGVGFTREGPWEPFAIFPVTEYGVTTYYQGRTYGYVEEGKTTKKFPHRSVIPFGSKYWLYGIDQLRAVKASRVILVESILNVLSLRAELRYRGIDNVVPLAIFRHHISKEQAAKLAACRYVKEICLCYDSDATKDAWKQAISTYGITPEKFTVVEMPEGVDANDDAALAVDRWLDRKKGAGTEGILAGLESLAASVVL